MADSKVSPYTKLFWWLMKQENVSLSEKAFYSHLFNLSTFRSTPKVEWEAWSKWFGCNSRTVKRSFDHLEQIGWVESGKRKRGLTPKFRPLIDPRDGKPLTAPKKPIDAKERMSLKQYRAYLTTSEWKKKRSQAIQAANNRCQICNKDTDLHVHHRTYDHIGHEEPGDLTVLCKLCHAKFHTVMTLEP